MYEGGEMRRGKAQRDTVIMLLLSLGLVLFGMVLTLAPLAVEAHSGAELFLRSVGVVVLIIGSWCLSGYWHQLQRELFPLV